MELVGAGGILDAEKDKDRAGHSDGKAEDIDNGKRFVADQVPPGDGEVVSEHILEMIAVSARKKCQLGSSLITNQLIDNLPRWLIGFDTGGVRVRRFGSENLVWKFQILILSLSCTSTLIH